MSIALSLSDDFEIQTYSGLKSYLTDHLQLDSDTVEKLPSLIRLAEVRLARLVQGVVRETEETLTATADTQTVSLPTDFKAMRQLKINGDLSYPLSQVNLNVVETYDHSGKPVAYSIGNGVLYLGPVPDDAYTFRLIYEQRLTPLTDDAPSNWLLDAHPDAYVYMCASVIEAYLSNETNAAGYMALALEVVNEINREANRQRLNTPIRLRSPVVV